MDGGEGLAALCEREYPRLVGLLALRVGDRHVAEELAQDALVQLCRRWPAIDNPSAWLTRVAINRSNSWLRRRVAERKAYLRHGPTAERVEAPATAEAVAIRQAISNLASRRQQTALILRFYEGLSVAETAEVMGCAVGTVKSLTHRALTELGAANDLDAQERVNHA